MLSQDAQIISNYNEQVSFGKDGKIKIEKWGRNPDVDSGTAAEDIMEMADLNIIGNTSNLTGPKLFVPVTTAGQVLVFSDDIEDAPGGTGISKLILYAMTENYGPIEFLLPVNGKSDVISTGSLAQNPDTLDYFDPGLILDVYSAEGISWGTNKAAVGNIAIAIYDAGGGPAKTLVNCITPNNNRTRRAIMPTFRGYKAIVSDPYWGIQSSTGGSSAVRLQLGKIETTVGAFGERAIVPALEDAGMDSLVGKSWVFPAESYVAARAELGGDSNTDVMFGFTLVMTPLDKIR